MARLSREEEPAHAFQLPKRADPVEFLLAVRKAEQARASMTREELEQERDAWFAEQHERIRRGR